jgi:hypothetical protein
MFQISYHFKLLAVLNCVVRTEIGTPNSGIILTCEYNLLLFKYQTLSYWRSCIFGDGGGGCEWFISAWNPLSSLPSAKSFDTYIKCTSAALSYISPHRWVFHNSKTSSVRLHVTCAVVLASVYDLRDTFHVRAYLCVCRELVRYTSLQSHSR